MAIIPDNPYADDNSDSTNGQANQAMLQGQVQPYQRPAAVQDLSAIPSRNDYIPDAPPGAGRAYVEGILARKQLERQTAANNREEEQLNMTKEEFGIKRQQAERELSIQNGMMSAANQGGYNGVIDYLKGTDPERALKFQDAKLALDDHIMNNDVLKTTSQRDKASAMAESYGILGKMGAALLAAPASDRQNMYQQMMPIVKTVNPNAPENVQDAVPMFMLSMAQSVPANQFWSNKNTAQQAYSEIGKLQQDLDNRRARGENSENSEGYRNIANQMDALQSKAQKSQWEADNYQYKTDLQNKAATQTLVNGMQTKYNTDSKNYKDYLDNTAGLQGAMAVLKTNPNNPDAQAQAGYKFARLINGTGQLIEMDLKRTIENNAALTQSLMDLKNLGTGQKIFMNPAQIKNMEELISTMDNLMATKQSVVNHHYTQLLDSNNLPRGSLSYVNSAPPAMVQYLFDHPDKKTQNDFYDKYGYMPYLGTPTSDRNQQLPIGQPKQYESDDTKALGVEG